MATITIPNCYTTQGLPATAASLQEVIYPPVQEGAQIPTPAQAAANITAAIANLVNTPQPGLL